MSRPIPPPNRTSQERAHLALVTMAVVLLILFAVGVCAACVENRVVVVEDSPKAKVREKSERSNAPEAPTQGPRIRGGDGR